ncbi:MAG: maleylpyruvate isomerase family mycothiol-dependent enzyme [Acidimicrobiia bacterium]|nr:maleylpyruvate isomerase family mycothiol-dependent enzyme [Acidimicrobiia bacterium]
MFHSVVDRSTESIGLGGADGSCRSARGWYAKVPRMSDEISLGTEYRNARLRMQALASELSDADAERVVGACPEWTVKDLFSHVTGIATDLGSGKRPSGDTQAWVDAQVADRRSRSLESVVAEWNENAPAFESMIDAAPQALWTLTYDTVVHEHDLFTAVGRKELPAFRAIIDGVEHVVGEGEPVLTLTATAFETLRLLGSRRTLAEMRSADFSGDLDAMLSGIVHMDLPEVSLGETSL